MEKKCPDCGGDQFVEDHAAGDVVCKGCGLVTESHLIDERSEWRTFSDKDKDTVDPNRVGGPSNPLLGDGGLSTVIGKAPGDWAGSHNLSRLHARSNNPDRTLLHAFKEIAQICERLGVVSAIKDTACEVFKQVTDNRTLKGRGAQAIYASCVYLACRKEKMPRTFKEICCIIPGVSKKEIGRCFKEIVESLKKMDEGKQKRDGKGDSEGDATRLATSAAPQVIHAVDYMRRFCSTLGLKFDIIKACEKTALAACPKDDNTVGKRAWDGKNPVSICAAIIYIVTQLQKDETNKPVMSDIVRVTGVAEVTIRAAYRDLYPELVNLLPKGLVSEEDLKTLPGPRNVE